MTTKSAARDDLAERYRAGASLLSLSREAGLSRGTLEKLVRDAGENVRGLEEAARVRHGLAVREIPTYVAAAERRLNRKALAEAIAGGRVRRTLPELDEDLAALPRCHGCGGPALRSDGSCGSCGVGRRRPRTPTGTVALSVAAAQAGVSRRTLGRQIRAGLVSANVIGGKGTGQRYQLGLAEAARCECGRLATLAGGRCGICTSQSQARKVIEKLGCVPIRVAASEHIFLTPEALALRGDGIKRVSIGGRVLLAMDARRVMTAAVNKHRARSLLAIPLAVLNGTDRIGRPPVLSDGEVEIVLVRRSEGVGWRTIQDELNAGRLTDHRVSHMAVKRAFERATAG